MNKDEKLLVDELNNDIQFFVRQYSLFVEVRGVMIKELKELREENKLLKAHARLNGHCYFSQSGPMLPFKWRG